MNNREQAHDEARILEERRRHLGPTFDHLPLCDIEKTMVGKDDLVLLLGYRLIAELARTQLQRAELIRLAQEFIERQESEGESTLLAS
ncbi:hypothetical protein [Phreatobacter oligotrophus]|uniref:hypothetical protein n=1 Tax=Phreatobacter oligotrophus TaxID=1122261 RepID=UPI002353F288|nr:hypothetical protein [Phreatobacter oligotrophus]MBX9992192.1 hypothetical protein [Phreatobacter oligotrophus]